MTKVNNLLKL